MSLATQVDSLADRVGTEIKDHDGRLDTIEAALVTLGAIDLTTIEDFLNARESFNSAAVEINTTTTLQDKINVTTKTLPAGDYRVTVSYGWNSDSGTQDFRSTFQINGANQTSFGTDFHRQEAKDNGGNTASTASNQHHGLTRTMIVTLPAGTHNLRLAWRTSSAGTEASMWDATIIIEKFNFS